MLTFCTSFLLRTLLVSTRIFCVSSKMSMCNVTQIMLLAHFPHGLNATLYAEVRDHCLLLSSALLEHSILVWVNRLAMRLHLLHLRFLQLLGLNLIDVEMHCIQPKTESMPWPSSASSTPTASSSASSRTPSSLSGTPAPRSPVPPSPRRSQREFC